jgi:polyhydroxybutyrate depolymerase
MRRLVRGSSGLAVVVLVAGCVAGTHGLRAPQSPLASASPPRHVISEASLPPACRPKRNGRVGVLTLPTGRRALLAVPEGDGRRAAVVALAGYGQTAEQLASQTRLLARGVAAGVVVVIVEGAGPKRSWNFTGATGYDDLGLLGRVRLLLSTDECVDRDRVVLTGLSDGGDMAAVAGCALPRMFRAVVTVAASTRPRSGCLPVRILAIHGDADPLDPYNGGPDGRTGYPAIPPAREAIADWARVDGCTTARDRLTSPTVRIRSFACGAELVTLEGGGHAWPGGLAVRPSLGRTSSAYDATAAVLRLA